MLCVVVEFDIETWLLVFKCDLLALMRFILLSILPKNISLSFRFMKLYSTSFLFAQMIIDSDSDRPQTIPYFVFII